MVGGKVSEEPSFNFDWIECIAGHLVKVSRNRGPGLDVAKDGGEMSGSIAIGESDYVLPDDMQWALC